MDEAALTRSGARKPEVMFQLTPKVRASGTTYRGSLRIAPLDLVERFGEHQGPSGDRKTSGHYVFQGSDGCVVVVYDWKSTSLYDARPEAQLPSTGDFWSMFEPTEFSVAASGKLNLPAFAEWLGAQ